MSSPVAWKTVFLIYLYNIFGTQAFYDTSVHVHVYVGEWLHGLYIGIYITIITES